MRVSTALIFQRSVNAMTAQQAQLSKTQNQLSTGRRILVPSDDPAGSKRLLDLQQTLGLTEQYRSNTDTAEARLSLEESTLGTIGDILQRVRELALQANNATLTNSDRQSLADEIELRADEILGLANTKDGNNEYLFGGFATANQPFTRSGATVTYNGDQGQRVLQLGPGFNLAVGDPGSDVFLDIVNGNGTFRTLDNPANTGSGVIDAGNVTDPAALVPDTYTVTFLTATTYEVRDSLANLVTSGNYTSGESIEFNGQAVRISGAPAAGDVFTAEPSQKQSAFTTLQNLVDSLNAMVVTPSEQAQVHNGINRFLADIDHVMDNLDTVRARTGARLNAAETERFVAEDFELQTREAISDIRDLDLAEAIARLNLQRTTLEAAQRSFGLVQNLNLFNFL